MFTSELEMVQDLINGYGEEITLGKLKEYLIIREEEDEWLN